MATIEKLIKNCLLIPIFIYQKCISPLIPGRCRFYPSCSEYAKEAIKIHDPFKASLLILMRLLKCQPLHAGGFDPVPEKRDEINNGL